MYSAKCRFQAPQGSKERDSREELVMVVAAGEFMRMNDTHGSPYLHEKRFSHVLSIAEAQMLCRRRMEGCRG